METVTHAPSEGIYPSAPNYAHAMEVRGCERLVFVAGTMGLDADGVAGSTVEEQLELIWTNIATILASADMTLENIVRLTAYLRDVAYAGANSEARITALGDRIIPTTAIVAQTLKSDWLVEIEVIAAA